MVLVESLVARFPLCVRGLTAEPRLWLDTLSALRTTSDPDTQRAKLRRLLGTPEATPDSQLNRTEEEELEPLRNFLMLTRNVDLRPESIRAILSLRVDRLWGPVHRGEEAVLAMRSGDTESFGAILAETDSQDRSKTVRAALDQIEADLRERLTVAVLGGINALATVMPGYREHAKAYRDDAADFLLIASPGEFRSLTSETTSLLFGPGLSALPRGAAIIDRAIASLAPASGPGATAIVRVLATISPDISIAAAATARPLLAQLGDDELAPLFEDAERNRNLLVPNVEGVYRARLTEWDANDVDQRQFEVAAQRLQEIRGSDWSMDDTADQVAIRATGQLALIPEAATAAIVAIANMLKEVGANTNVDALASGLANATNIVCSRWVWN